METDSQFESDAEGKFHVLDVSGVVIAIAERPGRVCLLLEWQEDGGGSEQFSFSPSEAARLGCGLLVAAGKLGWEPPPGT